MTLDGHIHIGPGPIDQKALSERLQNAGMRGAALFSLRPSSFTRPHDAEAPESRLDNLFAWCEAAPNLYPVYWIDPTEKDALAQVAMAVERGVAGFKVICDHFYPGRKRALRTFQAIADTGKPIFFHSGILWDGKASSQYNRPANFEVLLDIKGLRFSLAHISWPWVDECIALYGKFESARRQRPDLSVEMYIDTTPGTPPIYRHEALTKIYTVGYNVAHNVFFGSDAHANDYGTQNVKAWIERDQAIFEALALDQQIRDAYFGDNLKRFLGL